MIWILATRGASTKLRSSPFTETAIEGVHSIAYQPMIDAVPFSGGNSTEGELGTYGRGLHRVSGYVFSHDGNVAETLFAIEDPIDLIIRYRASGEVRKRTLTDVLFVGKATVTVPSMNRGTSELIGVPFRVQIPPEDTLNAHVVDAEDS